MKNNDQKYVMTFEQYVFEARAPKKGSAKELYAAKGRTLKNTAKVGAAIGVAAVAAPIVGGVLLIRKLNQIRKKRKYISALVSREQDPAKRDSLKKQLKLLSTKELQIKAQAQARKSVHESELLEKNTRGKAKTTARTAPGMGKRIGKAWKDTSFVKKAAIVGGAAYGASKLVQLYKRKQYLKSLLADENDPIKKEALKAKLQALSTAELKYKTKDKAAKMHR